MIKNFESSLFTLYYKFLWDYFNYTKNNPFLSTPIVKNKLGNSYGKHLKVIKLMITFYLCLHNFSPRGNFLNGSLQSLSVARHWLLFG